MVLVNQDQWLVQLGSTLPEARGLGGLKQGHLDCLIHSRFAFGCDRCYPMLRNSASGPEIGLPGRV